MTERQFGDGHFEARAWLELHRRRRKKKDRKARFVKSGLPVFWLNGRLSCCGFGFSDFSDDAELLHQA